MAGHLEEQAWSGHLWIQLALQHRSSWVAHDSDLDIPEIIGASDTPLGVLMMPSSVRVRKTWGCCARRARGRSMPASPLGWASAAYDILIGGWL